MRGHAIRILPETPEILSARQKWRHIGNGRPEFAERTADGEESVWDFPRPPVSEVVRQSLRVYRGQDLVAETQRGVRIKETAGAPTYYFPPADVDQDAVTYGELTSTCEWKGVAQEAHVLGVKNAGWRYVRMFAAFADLFEWVSFYPKVLRCFVGDELVEQQPGDFYGGWVTHNLRGPIKGRSGSEDW